MDVIIGVLSLACLPASRRLGLALWPMAGLLAAVVLGSIGLFSTSPKSKGTGRWFAIAGILLGSTCLVVFLPVILRERSRDIRRAQALQNLRQLSESLKQYSNGGVRYEAILAPNQEVDPTAFDSSKPADAVRQYIYTTYGPGRLRQLVGLGSDCGAAGGSVAVRFRDDAGRREDRTYWAMRLTKDGPFAVFEKLPAHLDNPAVVRTIAYGAVKRMGYHVVSWGLLPDWQLGERFAEGATSVCRVDYRLAPPATEDDYRHGSALAIATHVAVCTVQKRDGLWQLVNVDLSQYQVPLAADRKEVLVRTVTVDEIAGTDAATDR